MTGDRGMHKRQSNAIGALLVAALLGLGACSARDESATESTPADSAPAIPVEVAAPVRGDIVSAYTGTAPIEAFADATVVAKVGGEVIEILAEEGDEVTRGQVLARLDGDRLRLTLAEIKARLDKLRQDHSRNKELLARNLISQGDFDKIQFEMQALEASHDLARLELGYTEIRAPIDGVVSERFIKTGNTIDVQSPAFKVTSLEPLVSYLHVPEREYRRLHAGLEADVTVDALPGATFTGIVARTSPVVDPATGTFKLTIEIDDDSRRLKPGMFGRIRVESERREDALKIPRNAILGQAGSAYVFVVARGIAKRRSVEAGYVDGAQVEILDGILDGEQIVVVGHSNLKDGAAVAVVETAPMMQATARDDR